MVREHSDPRLSTFLEALRRRPRAAAPPLPDLEPVRQVVRSADLPGLFVKNAKLAGMSVRICRHAELTSALVEEMRGASVDSAILAIDRNSPIAGAALVADQSLHAAGIRTLDQAGDEAWFSSAAGVTTVRAAVAETGSLLVASGEDSPRSGSLIPPLHVALVAASQIVPDLVDAFAVFSADTSPAGIALITGPSKTADIEGVLVTGVHGPGRVIILLVTDE